MGLHQIDKTIAVISYYAVCDICSAHHEWSNGVLDLRMKLYAEAQEKEDLSFRRVYPPRYLIEGTLGDSTFKEELAALGWTTATLHGKAFAVCPACKEKKP